MQRVMLSKRLHCSVPLPVSEHPQQPCARADGDMRGDREATLDRRSVVLFLFSVATASICATRQLLLLNVVAGDARPHKLKWDGCRAAVTGPQPRSHTELWSGLSGPLQAH